jgi:hypothetical protein
MAVDGDGNVVVTARSVGLGSSHDYATIKYSSSGMALWTNRYNGPGNGADEPQALVVDAIGDVFVTGNSPGIGTGYDYATIKYSGGGAALWTNRYHGPGAGSDTTSGVAVDASGNVFVTGCCAATIGYSSAGEALWTNRASGAAQALAVDAVGNVFVTGGSSETIKYSSSIVLPHLSHRRANNQLVLSWTNAGFVLQGAPIVPRAFTNIPGATSPYTNSPSEPQQFFRLISN